MYDYLYSMVEDIKTVFNDYDWESTNHEDLADEMHDKLWADDSVTGNASGSYTCNSGIAKEYVMDNIDLCKDALMDFCVESEEIADHFLNEDWEYFDVSIRCNLLHQAIEEYLTRFYDDFEADESDYPAEVEING